MSNAAVEIAANQALAELVAEIKATAGTIAASHRPAIEEIADCARSVGMDVIAGRTSPAQAKADIEKLWNATRSRLISAGYDLKAERIDMASRALAIVLKLATAALAA